MIKKIQKIKTLLERDLFNSLPLHERKCLSNNGKWNNSEEHCNFIKRFKCFGKPNELLGYLDLLKDTDYPNEALHMIAVNPKFRRKGVASILVKNMLSFIDTNNKKLHIKRVNWIAFKQNKASCNLAKKLGWIEDIGSDRVCSKGIIFYKNIS